METYLHTQSGRVIVVALGGVALLCAVAAIYFPAPLIAYLIGILMVLCAWLFSSLTVKIHNRQLRWWFGPGIIRKQVNLSEIQSVSAVRTTWYDGWGIHYTKNGWLYNIAGRDAVAVQLKSGKKFALGTNEPEALVSALSGRLSAGQRENRNRSRYHR